MCDKHGEMNKKIFKNPAQNNVIKALSDRQSNVDYKYDCLGHIGFADGSLSYLVI